MEFRRIEVRKLLRYREMIDKAEEVKGILSALKNAGLEFSIKLSNMGGKKSRCIVQVIEADRVQIYSNYPSKLRLNLLFVEIEQIEVESNCDFVAEEKDDGGRWSRLM